MVDTIPAQKNFVGMLTRRNDVSTHRADHAEAIPRIRYSASHRGTD
jgi:hypothetical protein